MEVIGFTNKYYTLWEITEDTKDLGNGCKQVITHFRYIQNLSFSKEEALKKCPGLKIDEQLRGKTQSWSTEKEVWDNVDTFRFGKYKYEKIANNHDNNYLEWYWDNVYAEHRCYVADVLKSRGYEVRAWISTDENGQKLAHQYLMSPEALDNERKEIEALDSVRTLLKNNEPIILNTEYNPNEDGELREGDVIYKFAEVKENYYRGFYYYLPVLNGKAKRIKNKDVKITKYTYEDNDTSININIIDFEIMK